MRFVSSIGTASSDLYIYDLGGSRSSVCLAAAPLLVLTYSLTRAQRQSWIPFFDDVQAIIFLAPLLFNLTLEEDSRISRIVSTFPCPRFHDVLRILP